MKKLYDLWDQFVHWIVVSSTDPSKASLTIKGILVGIVPTIMFLLGVIHLNVGQEDLSLLIDSIAAIIQLLLSLIAVVMTTIGMIRKVLNTFLIPTE